MQLAPLTFKSIRARAVVLKLRRPVVARIATISDWPLILIDLFTEEGIVGQKLKKALASIGCWTIEIVKRSDGLQTVATPQKTSRPIASVKLLSRRIARA